MLSRCGQYESRVSTGYSPRVPARPRGLHCTARGSVEHSATGHMARCKHCTINLHSVCCMLLIQPVTTHTTLQAVHTKHAHFIFLFFFTLLIKPITIPTLSTLHCTLQHEAISQALHMAKCKHLIQTYTPTHCILHTMYITHYTKSQAIQMLHCRCCIVHMVLHQK